MTSDNVTDNDQDSLAQLARIIYEEMNVEPRRMNIAIELATHFLAQIRQELVRKELRGPTEADSSDLPPASKS